MKTNNMSVTIFIIIMIALIFTGCGGIPGTPDDEEVDQEYVVEEKSFNVDADQGGTFSLSDGTELKIDPGDLSDDAYVVLKRVLYDDLKLSKESQWFIEHPFIWIVDIIDCDDLLSNAELYMVTTNLEDIGGKITGGIVRLKDGAFELVNEFTASVGEKVLVSIEEIGMTAYLFVTNPVNDVMIMNDLVVDINSAVKFYYDGNCTSLFSLYQQAQQEEENAGDDLENYPGVTREDAEEIFAKLNSWETIIDLGADLINEFAPTPVTAAYSIYSAVVGIGEICKYTNAYIIAQNKSDIYSSKIFKRRVIEYLYKQDCIEENHSPVISDLTANPSSVYINQTTTITCIASDEDVGDTLTYTWTKNGGTFEGSTSGSTITWKAPSTKDNYTVTCEVSDGEASDSEQVIVSVGDVNHAPQIETDPVTSATKGQPYSYDVNATDPDVGDSLTYSLTTHPLDMSINFSTGVITWIPTSIGDYDVIVKVTDNGSPVLSDTQSYVISVHFELDSPQVSASDGTHNNKVALSCNSVTGATHYQFYRATSSGGTKQSLSSWQTSRTYDDFDASPAVTYYYFVRAATSSSGANASPYSTYDPGWKALIPPQNVEATNGLYPDKVRITWNNVPGASYYHVYRATSYEGTKISLGSWQTSTTYYDYSMDPGDTYYYFVKAAINSSGLRASEYSTGDSGNAIGGDVDPPTGVDASDGDYTDKVRISWNSVSGATHYKVYRARSSGETKVALSGWQTSTSYDDTSADFCWFYSYWVKAATSSSGANASGYSSYNTGWRRLEKPQNITASIGEVGRTVISWDPVERAVYYRVYRSLSLASKIPITDWFQTTTYKYNDYTGEVNKYYWYWVKAAYNTTGLMESDWSDPVMGYRK